MGDVEEALNPAAQMGDDRLQRRLQGYVTPESFTYGTSEQRVCWFKNGMRLATQLNISEVPARMLRIQAIPPD